MISYAAVANDKVAMQRIASSLDHILDWTATGDPCGDNWEGVYCDTQGYIKIIELGYKTLSGISSSSFTYETNVLNSCTFYF